MTLGLYPEVPVLSPNGIDWSSERAKSLAVRNQVLCSSDVVVRGVVTSATGYITYDDSSVYSVYKVKVTDRLRSDVASDEIEVTGPGGAVEVDGKRITYDRWPYRLQGNRPIRASHS